MDGDVKGLTMQNKPQLTAEMEKRFNEQFAHLSVLIDQALSYTYVDSKNMGELKIKDIKHFLATALEEQRADLKEIFDCPYIVNVASCPNRDSSRAEEAPDQVVGTLHMSYRKYKKLLAILNGKGAK